MVSYRIQLPGNTALNSSRQAAESLTTKLNAAGLTNRKLQVQGGYTDQSNLANLAREGLNKFKISVPVNGWKEAELVERIINEFDSDFPGWSVEPLSDTQSFSSLLGADQPPVLFRFIGNDRGMSERLSAELSSSMEQAGLNGTIRKQYEQEVDTWNIRFKTDRMLQLGIEEQDVIRYLESITRGSWVTDWNRQDERIGIRLVGERSRLYEPNQVTMRLNNNEIPLEYIADIKQIKEPEQLERVNQTPVLSYVADWNLADWWLNRAKVMQIIREFSRETGMEVQIGGNVMMVQNLMLDMAKLLGISILVIYLILAIQFENLKYPFIIILAVPFAWVGALLIMYLTGTGLNAMSFMGVLILTGIAVNDSILKVDFMRRYLADSGDLDKAVELAGKHRFRPVVMTSVTTILGLIPMLIPFGEGYAFRQSLALALMGGMITSTILTLYLIPVIFRWLETNHNKLLNKVTIL